MRYRMLMMLAGVLLTAAAASAQTEMKEYVSAEGRFRVLMPGTPTIETQNVTYADSNASATMYMASVDLGDDATYAVSYYDYPPGVANGTPEQILAQARDASISGKTLVWDVPIALGRVPGRAYRAVLGDGNVMEFRIYLVGQRLYSMVVGATPKLFDGLDRKTFFDSFTIDGSVTSVDDSERGRK